ncbi:unnamed protein product, partial [Mesorhabditis spiculigera]
MKSRVAPTNPMASGYIVDLARCLRSTVTRALETKILSGANVMERSAADTFESRKLRKTMQSTCEAPEMRGSTHQVTIGEAKQQTVPPILRGASEGAIQNKAYVVYGAGKAFLRRDEPCSRHDIGNGQERRQGLTQGVRFIEGNGGGDDKVPREETRRMAALVLDAKVGSFYKTNSFIVSIAALNNWSNPNEVFWNLSTVKRAPLFQRFSFGGDDGHRLHVHCEWFRLQRRRGFNFRAVRDYEQ